MKQEDLGIDLRGIYTGNLEIITTDELDTIAEIFKYAMFNDDMSIHDIDGNYIREALNERQ